MQATPKRDQEMSDQQPYELAHDADPVVQDSDDDSSSILEDDDLTVVPPALSTNKSRGRVGRRLMGLIAALLGLIGCLVSVILVLFLLRTALGVGDAADDLMEPISSSVDRLETRVDQTDDLVGRSGVDAADLDQLSARADGLADLADGAQRSFSAIIDHPVYRWLPIDLESLSGDLTTIEQSSTSIAQTARSGADNGRIPTADVSRVRDQLNDLQAGFGQLRASVEAGRDSLVRWIRLATLAGVALALWSLWAQSWLMRRGWRGMLGHAP